MSRNEPLEDKDSHDAIHALHRELSFWYHEADALRALPQARLGRALMPPGSTRERFFNLLMRTRDVVKAEGIRGTFKRANRKILVKLRLAKPAALPLTAATPQLAPSTETSNDRFERILQVLRRGSESVAAAKQYYWNLNYSTASRVDRGPNYVEHVTAPEAEHLVKLIAFYLPQFHPIPENDSEWGRGFTEWNNVTRAFPQFLGHYQPHLPEDVGFYDLRVGEVQERQVELAKQYGIHGFAFYYYWFGGRRLLEKPLDGFLANPKIDFPFCLIWANENWTRRWDGHEDDVFVAQVHTPDSDVQFVKDIGKYLKHPNYIRIEGKPVVMVYKCQLLPDAAQTVKRWRDYARESGIGELYLIAAQTMGFEDPTPFGFDAAMQFPPHNEHMKPNVRLDYWDGIGPRILNRDFDGGTYSYPAILEMKLKEGEPKPYLLYETAFPMWDNTPRRPSTGWIYAYSSPELYRLWLTRLCN
ncbi:MAG: hypothetical protein QOJ65_120, partial [Fimbriimonadaceae bacterium]|nr:hypothetical protein [Fimbriimonadaceae bacterium]